MYHIPWEIYCNVIIYCCLNIHIRDITPLPDAIIKVT